MLENDVLSAYTKLMEVQNKAMRKLSLLETPVSLAMKHSARGQYENSSAAQARRKASMSLGESDVMNILNRKFSFLDSQVTIAIKQAQIPQLNQAFTAVDALSLAIKKMEPQNEWQQKMGEVFSPLTEQSAAFKLFHEQTTKIAQIFDPSVSDYLGKSVRTTFDNVDSINPIEAIYLKSFEELGGHITEDISEQISVTPRLIEIIRDLVGEFADTYLHDTFIDKLATLIADRLGVRKPDVIIVSSFITFCVFILMPQINSYLQCQKDEDQYTKIENNTVKNKFQDKKVAKLEFTNQQEDVLKITKENMHNFLNNAIPDFEGKLKLKFKNCTVKRYTLVAASFVDYLYEHKVYSRFHEITKDDIDNFVMDTQYDVLRNFDEVEITNKLDSFLAHLNQTETSEKGVVKTTK